MSSGIAEAWRTCRTSSASVDHWLYALVSYSVSQCTREIGVRIMQSLLYSTSATDALSFAATSFTLIAVALLACYMPARRAMKVDSMVALRYE